MRPAVFVLLACGASACASEPALHEPAAPEHKNAINGEPGRKFDPEHRWDLTDPAAVKKLEGTQWGEQEINEFWTRKGWRLTKHEERYMATVADLVRQGKVTKISHWGMCPFDSIWQTLASVTIEGVSIAPQTEFWLDMNENEDELKVGKPRFLRVNQYEEEHQGHSDQASDNHAGEQHSHHHDHDHDD
ncbi:MAG TPA: hypothetical protein VIF62_29120 [Labilithrix sp.]|jgi:hypothetical protein